MESINQIVVMMSGWLWGWPLIICLLGTHIFLTFRLRFIQRYLGKSIKISITKDDLASGDVSQFSALATALAATIGTGNIVGVATAVSIGGPGAVFWTWVTGIFGISTKYAEGLLAVKYRVRKPDGTMAGGPMYVIEHGMGKKWLAICFALFTSIAAFGIGNMVQANSLSSMVKDTFNVPTYITGIIMAVLVAAVVIGGIKNIASVCNILVPFMALFYILSCLIILSMHISSIPSSIALIFKSAFTGQAAMGGFVGSTLMISLRYGVARGLFSNESGLGSAPIVAAAAQTRNSVRQAMVSSTATFWDTVVICFMTGLVLTNTGAWNAIDPLTGKGYVGGQLSQYAFGTLPGGIGKYLLAIGLITFVFSTILGWSYYGEKSVEYLIGEKAIKPYRILWVVFVFCGSVFSIDLVWNLADLMNGLMALPNLISLIALSGVIVSETKKYLWEDRLDEVDEGYIIKEKL